MGSFPPALVLLGGGVLVLLAPARLRPVVFMAAALLVAAQIFFWLESGQRVETQWLGLTITPLRVDELSLVFGYVFSLMGVIGGIYSLHVQDRGFHAAALSYGGAALGAVFAGDLLTLVLAWEVMAIASAYLVLAGGFPRSPKAGARYLYVHLAGGTVLLAGVLWHLGTGGGIAFDSFGGGPAAWLVLAGFSINAAIPPFHAWLADAYPEASVTGTIFLSAFTTKTAVYVLARAFSGWEILIPAGVVMALFGVVYAVLENDTRRLLAYHIISQVGFMVAAVGIGTQTAINGAAAHAFAHVLYKGLLLMAVGAVLHANHTSKMTELGGLPGAGMRIVFLLYMIGGLSISAFPLSSGFVSKSMVIFAAEEEHLTWVVFCLYGASVGTFLHTGLKLPYFTWFGRPQREVEEKYKLPWGMYVAMALAALLSIGIGVYPQILYERLPYPVHYEPYTVGHVVHTLELMAFTGLGFWLFLKALKPHSSISLDIDWFYREAGYPARRLIIDPLAGFFAFSQTVVDRFSQKVSSLASNPQSLYLIDRRLSLGITISLVIFVAAITVVWAATR